MQVNEITTNGKATVTGKHMHDMVRRYRYDMLPYAHLTLSEVFGIIKAIPFRPDPPDEETLMRPLYTMQQRGWGGDCDDKAIALASWACNAGIPYRFVAVRRSDMPVLHHVFCELYIDGTWIHADPTYSFNTLGRQREPYVERVLI